MNTGDEGSGIVEYLFGTAIVLLPLIYLTLALGEIQAASYTAGQAASAIARDASGFPDARPERRAQVGALIAEDFGIEPRTIEHRIDCDEDCRRGGDLVTVEVTIDVALPGIPTALSELGVGTVRVRAEHSDVIAPQA